MKNRFNINEEEKSRIRGLHEMQVINEQGSYDKELSMTHEEFMGWADGYCKELLGPDGETGSPETEKDDPRGQFTGK